MGAPEPDPEIEIEQIEAELQQRPQLTDRQIDDIRAMCERIRSLCRARRFAEARRTKVLCMNIMSQGAPVPE